MLIPISTPFLYLKTGSTTIKMKAIIFGAGGQDAYYLSSILKENDVEVIGISRSGNFIRGSVADYAFVEDQIKHQQPSYIFHLAANSSTKHNTLFENHETISTGTLNVLEAARLHCSSAKIFLSGSAMQFRNSGLRIDEQTEFEANNPYAVARIQSVYAGRYYRDRYSMQVYIGYFFNHDSPLRNEHHVNQKIAKAIQRINSGANERIVLGNMDVQKEFGFAGDSVAAIWTLMEQNDFFEAIIGTGKAYSIKDWVIQCFSKTEKNWQDYIDIKDGFKSEYQILISNPTLIKSLGWQPQVGFEQLAEMMMLNQLIWQKH